MPRPEVFQLDALRYYFDDVEFPAQRDALLQAARRHNGSDPFMRALEDLPKHNFESVDEVCRFLNGDLDIETLGPRSPRH
jgi:hypothetical protein